MKKILAHSTFDIIHYGHIKYLEKSKSFGDYLIVYVTSDKLARKNEKNPYFNENIRMKMISSLKVVDEVILRDEPFTPKMIKNLDVDIFVTTSNSFNYLNEVCKVIKIERTKNISSTDIKKHLLSTKEKNL